MMCARSVIRSSSALQSLGSRISTVRSLKVEVARASTLLGLFVIATPNLYSSFQKVCGTFGTKFEQRAVEQLYEQLPASSFSEEILMRGVNLGVLPVSGVLWNDLGEPVRVIETLNRPGLRLEWPAA